MIYRGSKIIILQMGRDNFSDDALGNRIGNRTFQTAAHLNTQGAILHSQQQQYPIINILTPEFPSINHPNGVLLNRFRLRRWHNQHRNLTALALFERRQFGFQCLARRRIKHANLIGDASL